MEMARVKELLISMARDKVFRALEHQFPDWTKWNDFLDGTFPRFTIDPCGKADVQPAMSAQN